MAIDRPRRVQGVPAGTLIQLLVDDLGVFTATLGGKASFQPMDPLARMLVLDILAVSPKGIQTVTTLASLGPDSSSGSIGHVVQMNMATYVVLPVPLRMRHEAGEIDATTGVIKRILTFGFPQDYTGVVQSFGGYTPIDTAQVSDSKTLMVARIDHSVHVVLPGTSAYACNPVGEANKTKLIEDGWRFSEIN